MNKFLSHFNKTTMFYKPITSYHEAEEALLEQEIARQVAIKCNLPIHFIRTLPIWTDRSLKSIFMPGYKPMFPKKRRTTKPGKILVNEFLKPYGMSNLNFASRTAISVCYLEDIIAGKEKITEEVAWKFSQVLGTTPEFWLSLQNAYDMYEDVKKNKEK